MKQKSAREHRMRVGRKNFEKLPNYKIRPDNKGQEILRTDKIGYVTTSVDKMKEEWSEEEKITC